MDPWVGGPGNKREPGTRAASLAGPEGGSFSENTLETCHILPSPGFRLGSGAKNTLQ